MLLSFFVMWVFHFCMLALVPPPGQVCHCGHYLRKDKQEKRINPTLIIIINNNNNNEGCKNTTVTQ